MQMVLTRIKHFKVNNASPKDALWLKKIKKFTAHRNISIRIVILRSFRFQLILMLLVLFAACASSSPIVERAEEDLDGNRVVIYVVGHGWHTGIIVPAADIMARLPALKTRFKATPYLEFGWGDKDFYQAEEPGGGLAVKALLWHTEAVMHVVAVAPDVHVFFSTSEIHRLCLLPGHYAALLDFIAGSFRLSEAGAAIPLGGGLCSNSNFYEAVGHYTLFNTCNTWTAKGLKSAGLDIDPTFKARASSVMDFLRDLDSLENYWSN